MVRHYTPGKERGEPDVRRARVRDLRDQGLSLRAIGAQLNVSEGTVRNDLKHLAAEPAPGCVTQLRKSAPDRGEIAHPDYAPATHTATVLPLRRSS